MKVYCDALDFHMELKYGITNVIVLESASMYRNIVSDILKSRDNDSETWIFSDNDKIIRKSLFTDVVTSVFDLDFKSKKIQNAIVENMNRVAIDEEHFIKTQQLLGDIEAYLSELEWNVMYTPLMGMPEFKNILKMHICGIAEPQDMVMRLDEYIKVSARLLCNKILILIGTQGCFEKEEWRQIEKSASCEEIYILCIEKSDYFNADNKIIIDYDGCRVV